MKIRPGRTRSLFAGILMLLVTIVGLAMMGSAGPMVPGGFGPFIIIWVVIGLVGAAMAFYNAFSSEGLPLYEVDVDQKQEEKPQGAFCPQCGEPVAEADRFCRQCGAPLDD